MNILSLENVSKSFGFKPLFENVTFGLDEADRVGVIGPNGSGKTTLLRVVAGAEAPDTGRVVTARGKSIAFLPQNPPYDADQTVLDAVFTAVFPADSEAMRLVREYDAACRALETGAEPTPELLERVADLTHRLEASGAWHFETDARAILTRLGVGDTAARMGALSGGQRKRVALAAALVAAPDLLILDEPTNHLDADTVAWLETHLARYTGALLLVTHDRYFLDRVVGRMVEVDEGTVQTFVGNYAAYLEKKDEQNRLRATEEQKRQNLIRRELAWLRRGARARATKEKAHVQRAEALLAESGPKDRAELEISVGSRRMGKRVLEIDGVAKGYGGKTLVEDFTYTMKRDDRIGIVGPNGSGKTTLLEMIAGRVAPDRGTVSIGQTIAVGYYDQESRALDDERRVIDYVRDEAEFIETADGDRVTASQMLEKFLFPPDAQYAPIGRLSGGERRRLYLLRVLMGAPNLLLLDEPTNDLDIPTLVTLEEYLDGFSGCLVVVSHDRYFLDRTVDHVFELRGDGRVRAYPGNYSTFREARDREAAEAASAAAVSAKSAAKNSPKGSPKSPTGVDSGEPAAKRKLTFKEQREIVDLEERIAAAEARKAEIEARMATEAGDFAVVHALYAEMQELDAGLDRDMERWAELAELA